MSEISYDQRQLQHRGPWLNGPWVPFSPTVPRVPPSPLVARTLLRIPTSQSSMRLRRLGSQEVDSGDTRPKHASP